MAVNVIGQRMNFMVILHGCWLVAILTRRHRAAIARLWPNYCLFLSLFLLYQYLLCLGIPPALCIDYPWRWSQAVPMNSALIKWLYLPDFFRTPNSTNLISDFLLLLCASQQWQVFCAERTEEWQCMAGVNTDHLELQPGEASAVPNFIYCRWVQVPPPAQGWAHGGAGALVRRPDRRTRDRRCPRHPCARTGLQSVPGARPPGRGRGRGGPAPAVTPCLAGPTSTC